MDILSRQRGAGYVVVFRFVVRLVPRPNGAPLREEEVLREIVDADVGEEPIIFDDQYLADGRASVADNAAARLDRKLGATDE